MPEVKGKVGRRRRAGMLQPLLQNRRTLVAGSVILAVIIVAGIAISLFLDKPAPKTAAAGGGGAESGSGTEAEVLPQITRHDRQAQGFDIFSRDPFATPLRLTGICTGGAGGSMAVIESGGTVYTVTVGDMIDGFWTVQAISGEGVLLAAEGREVTLSLHHRSVEEKSGSAAESAAEEEES